MAGLHGGVAANVVKTALDKVFNAEFDYPTLPGVATAQDVNIYMQDSSDRASVITEQFQGSGYWDTRDELQDVPEGATKVDNQKSFSIVNFAKSVDVSKNLFDDDQHSVVQMMIRNMARNARLTRDRKGMEIFVNAFGTTLTNDGVSLINDSHTTLDGTTVDNDEAGALSDSWIEASIVKLVEQKTQDGTLGGHEPACLLVPPSLFKEANIFTKSELRPTTANNDLNYVSYIYPGLVVKQSPFLGSAHGGSDALAFLLSRNHSIYRWVRQALNTDLVDYKYQRNNNYIYKGEYREVFGAISYEGIVGTDGT